MMSTPSVRAALCLSLGLVSSVVAGGSPLATFTPCPDCPSKVAPTPITITEQYQVVSTCTPETTCNTYTNTANCTTNYPFSTYTWVSTVIPCAGPSSSCTVTEIEELITVNEYSTVITEYWPATTLAAWYANATTTTTAAPSIKTIEVIVIDYVCPFADIGPLAIPGYGGSGLCEKCEEKHHKGSQQSVEAHKCVNGACNEWTETWTYEPSTVASTTYQACSTSQVASTAGTYTVTVAPAKVTPTYVNNAPTTITVIDIEYYCPENGVYTVTIEPEICTTTYVPVPTTIYIDTTVTRTIIVTTTVCNTIVSGSTVPPTVSATTTTASTTGPSQPDKSSDPELDERAPAPQMAKALRHREIHNKVRRGGLLRNLAREPVPAPLAHKRDFSIPKKALL